MATDTDEAFDPALADDLETAAKYSHGDYVEVRIERVSQPRDGVAVVEFAPPGGANFERRMDVSADPEYVTEFRRLLDLAGYRYSNAADMVGDRVPARYTDDGWEILYPEPTRSLRERAVGFLRQDPRLTFLFMGLPGSLLLWPVTGLFATFGLYLYARYSADDDAPEFGLTAALVNYVGLLYVWVTAVILLADHVGIY